MRAGRLPLLLLGLALACGGKRAPADADDAKSAEPKGDVLYKRLVLSLEMLPPPPDATIDAGGSLVLWLILANETGSTRRVDIGELPGPCTDVSKREKTAGLKPLLAVDCTGGAGMRVRVVQQLESLIVVRAPGATGDDLDLEESHRVDVPRGASVQTE